MEMTQPGNPHQILLRKVVAIPMTLCLTCRRKLYHLLTLLGTASTYIGNIAIFFLSWTEERNSYDLREFYCLCTKHCIREDMQPVCLRHSQSCSEAQTLCGKWWVLNIHQQRYLQSLGLTEDPIWHTWKVEVLFG